MGNKLPQHESGPGSGVSLANPYWALATDQQLSSNKLLAVERETAIVTKITRVDTSELHTKLGAGINVYQGYVELADGTEIELGLVPPTPKVGDRIPILVERYENGKTHYRIDRERWQMSGPQ